MKIFYSPKCLGYSQQGHPESPVRVSAAHNYLTEKGYESAEPNLCTDDDILLAHTPALLNSVRKGNFLDFDTPAFTGIFDIAKLAAGSAIDAAMHCLNTGEKAFSLMRPPGHHATRNNLGGFCYFNNIAIASLKAKELAGKVAIVDFDCHHGNGTEDIFLGDKSFLYISLHQSPLYPGTGLRSRGNCINYPLSEQTSPAEYLSVLEQGLEKVEKFNPDLLAISAGFDTYKHDPITSFSLEKDTYNKIGRMLAAMNKPSFSILEGGYSSDLAECIYEFLTGLEE
jgi:acetoin utilization deacetylase AcuC-like enzyme